MFDFSFFDFLKFVFKWKCSCLHIKNRHMYIVQNITEMYTEKLPVILPYRYNNCHYFEIHISWDMKYEIHIS